MKFKAITSGKYPGYLWKPLLIFINITVVCGLKVPSDNSEPCRARHCTCSAIKASSGDIWEATGNSIDYNKRQNGRTGIGAQKKEHCVMWPNCKIEKLHAIISQAECDDVKGKN